jgi:hypothetical protein
LWNRFERLSVEHTAGQNRLNLARLKRDDDLALQLLHNLQHVKYNLDQAQTALQKHEARAHNVRTSGAAT